MARTPVAVHLRLRSVPIRAGHAHPDGAPTRQHEQNCELRLDGRSGRVDVLRQDVLTEIVKTDGNVATGAGAWVAFAEVRVRLEDNRRDDGRNDLGNQAIGVEVGWALDAVRVEARSHIRQSTK